jgi:hypothetical protein
MSSSADHATIVGEMNTHTTLRTLKKYI